MEVGIRGWIWSKRLFGRELEEPVFLYFRKTLIVPVDMEQAVIRISADSRYKFYIDGVRIAEGPLKGNDKVWYYDTIDISRYLTAGEHVLSAEVLRYPRINKKGNESVWRTATPGFYLSGEMQGANQLHCFYADETWKCMQNSGIKIVSEADDFAPLQIYERVDGSNQWNCWRLPEFDDNSWENCIAYTGKTMERAGTPANQIPRTIPLMRITPGRFIGVSNTIPAYQDRDAWERMLQQNGRVVIPAHSVVCVDLDAGEEMTGYLKLTFISGSNAVIKLLQAECYARLTEDGRQIKKGDRTDSEHGCLRGFTDEYRIQSNHTGIRETYEPFWFRTFRYVQVEIQTALEELVIESFVFDEIGYPLDIKTEIKTSDSSMAGIWDISLRSLVRCMHETYEDCPFYEQVQYAMDSRNQILYTYAVAADDRLARKCMEDFKHSQRADGILNGASPCYRPNVIPGFSIYYIGMLFDHMMYFGDKQLIKEHLPAIDGILNYFEGNLTSQGIVGVLGGLNGADRYWSFIDWTPEWEQTTGVPDAIRQGAVTMESFLYVLGLQYGAKLCRFVGRSSVGTEYQSRADKVKYAINRYCRNSRGIYQDGPGVERYSQHCQVFAILTETVDAKAGRRLLEDTLYDKENYAQCSVAMMFYLFRAMEKCSIYYETDRKWDIWREMIANKLTTCAEDPVSERSDCHAWGAVALYELPSVVLGVTPGAPGYEVAEINPHTDNLDWARGKVLTPKGMIEVSWRREGDRIRADIKCPRDMKIRYHGDERCVSVDYI